MRHIMFVWMTALFAVAGCGTEASPVEKCDDLVDTLCDKGVQCLGGSHAECVQAAQTTLPCGSARSVTTSYDRCVDQLESASCSVLFAFNSVTGELELRLPADCRGVIQYFDAPSATLSEASSSMANEP
jgi:hypothetical protein